MRREHLILALIMLLAVVALLVDLYLFPEFLLPAPPYAIPILIAARFLPPRMVAFVAGWSVTLEIISAALERPSSPIWILYVVATLFIGYLATMLTAKARNEARLKEEAEASMREVASILESITDAFLPSTLIGALFT